MNNYWNEQLLFVIKGKRQLLVKAFTFIDALKFPYFKVFLVMKKRSFSSSFVRVTKLFLQKVTVSFNSQARTRAHTSEWIVRFLFNNQPDALINEIYSVIKLHMFRASSLPIIRSSLLYEYIRHWQVSCRFLMSASKQSQDGNCKQFHPYSAWKRHYVPRCRSPNPYLPRQQDTIPHAVKISSLTLLKMGKRLPETCWADLGDQ